MKTAGEVRWWGNEVFKGSKLSFLFWLVVSWYVKLMVVWLLLAADWNRTAFLPIPPGGIPRRTWTLGIYNQYKQEKIMELFFFFPTQPVVFHLPPSKPPNFFLLVCNNSILNLGINLDHEWFCKSIHTALPTTHHFIETFEHILSLLTFVLYCIISMIDF